MLSGQALLVVAQHVNDKENSKMAGSSGSIVIVSVLQHGSWWID